MTCTAARKWASCDTNITATPNRASTIDSAACTGWLRSTTPSPPPSTMAALMTNTIVSIMAGSLLSGLRGAHAVAELAAPADDTLEVGAAARRRRPHPAGRVLVVAGAPVLPRQVLRLAVVADQQLALRVHRIVAVGEGELEQLALRDRLRRAGLDAQVAVDAAEVVDLVDEPVALAGRGGVIGVVVLAAHVDAIGGAHTSAELAADALLHAVLVAVEDVPAVQAVRLGDLGVVLGRLALAEPAPAAVLGRDLVAIADLSGGDEEASEVAHQNIAPSRSRVDLPTRSAATSRPEQ